MFKIVQNGFNLIKWVEWLLYGSSFLKFLLNHNVFKHLLENGLVLFCTSRHLLPSEGLCRNTDFLLFSLLVSWINIR